MKHFLILLAVLSLPLSAWGGKPPAWFLSGKTDIYDTDKYIIGVGSGNTYEAATQEALADMARSVKTTVKATSETTLNSYRVGDREEIKSQFEANIKAVSEMTFKGAETVKKDKVDGVFYVMTAVSKDKWLQELHDRLVESRLKVQRIRDNADSLKAQGNIFEALELLMSIEDAQAEATPLKALYTVISGGTSLVGETIDGPALVSDIRLELNKVRLEQVSGNDQTVQRGRMLPEPLTVRAVCDNPPLPIPKARLRLLDASRQVVERNFTDDNGLAKFWVIAEGSGKGQFSVTLDFVGIPDLFKKDLSGLQVPFHYTAIEGLPLSFAVKVFDKKGEHIEAVERAVEKSIVQSGHLVSSDAPLLLTGKLVMTNSNIVNGIHGTQYSVSTEVELFLKLSESGDKLGSVTIKAKSVDKKSEDEAVKKSHHAMKIPRKEMEKLLTDAGDKLKKFNEKQSQAALTEGKKYYDQGDYENALRYLSKVNAGDKLVSEAQTLLDKIKSILIKSKEKPRSESLSSSENSPVPSSIIAAETIAPVLIEQPKQDLEKIKDQIALDLTLMVTTTSVVESNPDIGKALRIAAMRNPPLAISREMSEPEKSLVGAWTYLGAVESPTLEVSFDESGSQLILKDKHHFVSQEIQGCWEAKEGLLILNNSSIPYYIDEDKLILSFNLNGRQWGQVYRR